MAELFIGTHSIIPYYVKNSGTPTSINLKILYIYNIRQNNKTFCRPQNSNSNRQQLFLICDAYNALYNTYLQLI